MKCHQCERAALYRIEENGPVLCLDCWHKLQSIHNIQFLQNAAMMNQSLDDMDLVVGFRTSGGRIPISEIAKAMQKRSVLNNIRISNSNVGVLNTGDLARIDAVITLTKNTNAENIGNLIRQLTQTTIECQDMAHL